MIRVAVVFPTANPERAHRAACAWSERGYEVRVLIDGDTKLIDRSVFSRVLHAPVYGGYFQAANELTSDAIYNGVDICVVAGDDMFPESEHTAQELAEEYFDHFGSGFGLMQPTGDKLPCRAFCGSPWMGREWIERINEGRGPYHPDYFQSHGDSEVQALAERLEVLWQRPDLTQFHDHYVRPGSMVEATEYQTQNLSKWWAHDEKLFLERKAAGFPGAWPVPACSPPPRAPSLVRHHSDVKRGTHSELPGWPTILNPKWGCLPPAAEPRATERVLHLPLPRYPELATALRGIATDYLDVDRRAVRQVDLAAATCMAAAIIKPTLVFIELQGSPAPFSGRDIAALREYCDPSAAIVTWDAEAHAPPTPGCTWLDELGAACDANLTVTTEHAGFYAAHGISRPGYLLMGCDDQPGPATRGVEPVVLVADYVPVQRRLNGMVQQIAKEMPTVGLYGAGWRKLGLQRYAALKPGAAPGIYAAARATIVIPNRSPLARYPGDKLLTALACGAVALIERFPDCEGLGLVDGVNCLLWRGWDGLQTAVARALRMGEDERLAMRAAAVALAYQHTLAVRGQELLAIVDAVRCDR